MILLFDLFIKNAEFNLIISPVNVNIDYEKAIINAVNEVWPESWIGCRFYLTNSWWRKIQFSRFITRI